MTGGSRFVQPSQTFFATQFDPGNMPDLGNAHIIACGTTPAPYGTALRTDELYALVQWGSVTQLRPGDWLEFVQGKGHGYYRIRSNAEIEKFMAKPEEK